jgi:hypothetical protein
MSLELFGQRLPGIGGACRMFSGKKITTFPSEIHVRHIKRIELKAHKFVHKSNYKNINLGKATTYTTNIFSRNHTLYKHVFIMAIKLSFFRLLIPPFALPCLTDENSIRFGMYPHMELT